MCVSGNKAPFFLRKIFGANAQNGANGEYFTIFKDFRFSEDFHPKQAKNSVDFDKK